ncbi:hypothetical protein FHY02_003200 [Sphingomonas sp. BK069]|nr:hypothetical protein [Sphingomonas sp. BK069]
MQLLPALTRDPNLIARERSVGSHLPYARHVDAHTLETRDGLLLQVIHLRGLLFETADSDELDYRKWLRDRAITRAAAISGAAARSAGEPQAGATTAIGQSVRRRTTQRTSRGGSLRDAR